MEKRVPSWASVGLTKDGVLQVVDLVVERVEHREEAVDELVDDQVDDGDLRRLDLGPPSVPDSLADVVHGLALPVVDGDDEVVGEDEVDLLRRGLVGGRPVGHHVHEAVVVLELGALAELLGVLDRELVDFDVLEQQVGGFVVDPVEVEPEEIPRREVLLDRLPGGRGGLASECQGPVHAQILVPRRRVGGDGAVRRPPAGAGRVPAGPGPYRRRVRASL